MGACGGEGVCVHFLASRNFGIEGGAAVIADKSGVTGNEIYSRFQIRRNVIGRNMRKLNKFP